MSRDVSILVKTQLSNAYLDGLRQCYGNGASIHNFSEVQSSSIIVLWRNLRLIAPDLLLIPVEDDNSRCILPIMKLIAFATRARQIAVVGPDYAETRVSRFAVMSALGSLLAATAASAFQTLLAGMLEKE